jgi:hypothetical protein
VDQVRSFSSIEHNEDGFFQYFALDFDEASSAFHGSDILTQAGVILRDNILAKVGVKFFAAAISTVQHNTARKVYKMSRIEQIIQFYECCLQDLLLKINIVTIVLKRIR